MTSLFRPKRIAPPCKRALLALTLAVLSGTCAAPLTAQTGDLPTLGDNADISLSLERKIGERIARDLYRDPDYLDDPLLIEYVQSIWQPLLGAARQRGELTPELEQRFAFEVLLGRDRSINAFAVPGGYLGLNLGLIGVASSADELAAVLAHELTHVTQRHIARQISKQNQQSPLLLATLLLGLLVASKNPDAANAIITGGQGVAAASQLGFSRDVEREADRIGFAVMTQAGFDPLGFVGLFEKLQQAARLNDNGSFPYLRTHPLTTERIAQARQRLVLGDTPQSAGTAPPQPLQIEHALMAARARVLSNPGADSLRAWLSQAQASDSASASQATQAAVLYAGALAAMQLRDFDQALVLASRLRRLVGEPTDIAAPGSLATRPGSSVLNTALPPDALGKRAGARAQNQRAARLASLLQAQLALAAGQAGRAVAQIDANANARPEVILRAQALLAETGTAPDVAVDRALTQQLQSWVLEHPRDAAAWQLLAAAYTRQNQGLRAIRAEAESHAVRFDYAAALDRFKAAQLLARNTAGAVDLIEASIIDTRARQVEAALKEQLLDR